MTKVMSQFYPDHKNIFAVEHKTLIIYSDFWNETEKTSAYQGIYSKYLGPWMMVQVFLNCYLKKE